MPLGDLSSPQPPAPVHSHSHSPSRHLSAAHSTLGCLPYTPASPGLATKLHPSLRPLWPQKGIQLSKPVPTLMPRVSWKPLKSAPAWSAHLPSQPKLCSVPGAPPPLDSASLQRPSQRPNGLWSAISTSQGESLLYYGQYWSPWGMA
jgi:hypothetical protein